MNLIEYNRRRNEGFPPIAAKILADKPSKLHQAIPFVYVVTILAIVLGLLKLGDSAIEAGQQEAASHARSVAQVTVDRLESVVLTCLNGGLLNIDGTAFTCRAESLEHRL